MSSENQKNQRGQSSERKWMYKQTKKKREPLVAEEEPPDATTASHSWLPSTSSAPPGAASVRPKPLKLFLQLRRYQGPVPKTSIPLRRMRDQRVQIQKAECNIALQIYHADLLSSDMISDDQQEARRLGGTIAEGGGPGRWGRGSCSPCTAGCRGTLRSSSVFQETLWSCAPCACILDDGRERPAEAARRAPWQPPRAPREQP